MENTLKRTWAEIDLDHLTHNFEVIRRHVGDKVKLLGVVKADGYGHGAVQCARVFAEEGAAWLAVSCLTEAVQLRKAGQTLPILILGHVQPAYAAALIQNDITVACYSLAQARALSEAAVAAGGKVHIHLKADTGMGRIGFALRTDFDAAIREMLEACALPGLEMTGLFQHFSVADDTAPENVAYTAEQHTLFVKAFHALKAAGREPALVHCDNSAGVMLHPDWPEGLPRERCMARPGIILYGYDPSDEVRFGRFKPVMTLKTVVSMIKEMQPGQCASYGRRFTAEKPTKVATLCTGYADGYPRLLSCGKGVVEIHGKACPVLGRVCMDQMMVDVTDVPEVREDEYYSIYHVRFGDRVQMQWAFSDSLDLTETMVPSFILQPIVENAFKHGVSNDRPSFIDIDIREEEGVLACRIENSFFPKSEADRSGSGIGLANLCRRLEMIYPGRYEMKYGQHGDTYETLLRINLTDR